MASSSIFVALSDIDNTGSGGGDVLRLDGCSALGIFTGGPEFSPENIERDDFPILVSGLSSLKIKRKVVQFMC